MSTDSTDEATRPVDHSQEMVAILTGVTRGRYQSLVKVREFLASVTGNTDESALHAQIFEYGLALLESAADHTKTAFVLAEMAPRLGVVLSPSGRIEESSTLLVDFQLSGEDEKNDRLVCAVGMAQTTQQYPVTLFTIKQVGDVAYCAVMNHRTAGPGDGKSAFGGWAIEQNDRAQRDEAESPVPVGYSSQQP